VSLLAAVGLLLANAFFVGAEFALISARRTRLERLAAEGNRRAVRASSAMAELSLTLAATQLGITAASLGLGAVAEPAVEHIFDDWFAAAGLGEATSRIAAFAVALLVVVTAHMVLGEMVPKNLAIAAPERAALWLGPPMYLIIRMTRPIIAMLNFLANACVRALRVEPVEEFEATYTSADLAAMSARAYERGMLDATEHALAAGALALHRTPARQVMKPWDRVTTVPWDVTPAELERIVVETGLTRFPVADGDVDYFLHANVLLDLDPDEYDRPIPGNRVQPLPSVAPDTPLSDALTLMQARHVELTAVREKGVILGIFSLGDVLQALAPD